MGLSVLISGTSRGIGEAIAEHFLYAGDTVVGFSREESSIDDDNYHHFTADISDESSLIPMFNYLRELGRVDVLINNAGVSSMNHILLMPYETAHKIVSVNLLGTFLLSRETSKLMSTHNFGRIINFVTVADPMHLEGEAMYSASKGGILSLTRTMAYELAPHGITVNAIGPNPIKTDLIKNVSIDKLNSVISKQAIKRFGTFEDVTNIIDFLIKPESNFITGQVIYLGGIS